MPFSSWVGNRIEHVLKHEPPRQTPWAVTLLLNCFGIVCRCGEGRMIQAIPHLGSPVAPVNISGGKRNLELCGKCLRCFFPNLKGELMHLDDCG